jgi:hypothetical protein
MPPEPLVVVVAVVVIIVGSIVIGSVVASKNMTQLSTNAITCYLAQYIIHHMMHLVVSKFGSVQF